MHQNAPFIPLNIKNRLPKEGGTPLLQPTPLASCGCSCWRGPFRLFLQNFLLFSNLSTSLNSITDETMWAFIPSNIYNTSQPNSHVSHVVPFTCRVSPQRNLYATTGISQVYIIPVSSLFL